MEHELSKIRLWLVLVALGGIGLALVLGFLVARAALKPVRDLSETAEHVRTTRDLSQRIQVSGNDERKRRLAYNAITRAKHEAFVVVQGEARVRQSPFVPGTAVPPAARQQHVRRRSASRGPT